MAYTAFAKMREINRRKYGTDIGPIEPAKNYGEDAFDLKSAALKFLHEECEGLDFDPAKEAEGDTEPCTGAGVAPGQIPYNMQMDINRLCLERELEKFIDSGVAEDAYTVYFCFLEMFFGHYGKSKKMVELLSEFESNGSSLLMKHRDHYSHSVYVFTLGLAIYETNENFRRKFKEYYGFDTDESSKAISSKAANTFLEYWGLTSLFHDIGYPFELPFEQVISYYEVDNQERGKGSMFLAYHDVDVLTRIGDEAKARLYELYHRTINTVEELMAFDITAKLGEYYGFTEAYLQETLHRKPVQPDSFGYYMDHAYFSASRLFQEMDEAFQQNGKALTKMHVDALSAIVMHNSLYKFAIAFYKKRTKPLLKIEWHPLAYMLMICDELQCWDRTAYGRNSRTELHPMGADFDFRNNAISVVYHYDIEEQKKITDYYLKLAKWKSDGEKGEAPRLKAYSDMTVTDKGQRFSDDIRLIVDTADMPLTVRPDTATADRSSKHIYLSVSNFLHLYDFAVALNARYNYQGKEDGVEQEQLQDEFESLSLEYQLSNINQAKSFSKYLNLLNMFYSDRPVNYEMVSEFSEHEVEFIAPLEHERWVREHQSMGWRASDVYETLTLPADVPASEESAFRKNLREQFRCHKLTMDGELTENMIFAHYYFLPEEEQGKDKEPFNCMLKLIKKFDGLRIYQLGM
ncbi:MAG: hypothetical protein IKG08_02660 [Eubacterium sp.]|nr:hypothetical protein [Eubacterium sp.]